MKEKIERGRDIMCVCVCVFKREREMPKVEGKKRQKIKEREVNYKEIQIQGTQTS